VIVGMWMTLWISLNREDINELPNPTYDEYLRRETRDRHGLKRM
jgi:hypothetical protein